MGRETMYTPLEALNCNGRFVTSLHDQAIPNSNILSENLRSGNVYIVIGTASTKNDCVSRIGPYHIRTHELSEDVSELPADQSIYDEFGNMFCSRLTQKGSDFSNPHLFESNISRWGYDVHGLQVGGALGRALRTSYLMREVHIDTEMIVGATKLENFYINGNFVNKEAYETYLVANLDVSENEKQRLLSELQKREYFVTYRLMSIQERLGDLFAPKSSEDLDKLKKRIADAVNKYEQHRQQKDPEYKIQTFDPNNKDDVKEYITKYIPARLGSNLGKMHGIGLHHKYLHLYNVTALGGIVDLDSVHGKPTGFPNDTEITPSNIKEDVDRILDEFSTIIGHKQEHVFPRYPFVGEKAYNAFLLHFLYNYFSEVLDSGYLSYKFLTVFYKYRDSLVNAENLPGKKLVDRIETAVDALYKDILPTSEDLLPVEISDNRTEVEDPLVNAKNEILQIQIYRHILSALPKQEIINFDTSELKDKFLDILTYTAFIKYRDLTTQNIDAYSYNMFKLCLNDPMLAYTILPYLKALRSSIGAIDIKRGTNLLSDIDNVYGHIIPDENVISKIWEFLVNEEKRFVKDFLNNIDNQSNSNKLDNVFADYYTNYLDVLVSRISTWAENDFNERLHAKTDNQDDIEAVKNDYKFFVANYVIIALGPEKIKELRVVGLLNQRN